MRIGRIIAAGVIALLGIGPVRADVTVVSKISITDPDKGGKPQTFQQTDYYKGVKSRTEDAEKVVILDFAAAKRYELHPGAKTYSVGPVTEPLEEAFGDKEIPYVADIRTAPTDKTRKIAGKNSRLSKFLVTLHPSENVIDAYKEAAKFLPTIVIEAERWTSDELKLNVSEQDRKMVAFQGTFGPQLFRALFKSMKRTGLEIEPGIGLAFAAHLTFQFPKDAPDEIKREAPKGAYNFTSEAVSISEKPLDDALFVVPADYKEVKSEDQAEDAKEKEETTE